MAGSTTIRELLIKLGVDADRANEQIEKFDDSLEKVKEHMGNLVDFAAKVATALATVGAAAIYTAGSTAQFAQQVERQANSLGLTTDAYQELLFAFEKFGVQGDDMADAFGQISQLAKDAAGGSKDMADKFKLLGISMEQLKTVSPDQLLLLIADGLAKTDDATTRLALSGSILGEGLSKVLGPLLMKGSAGFKQLAKDAQAAGRVMSEDNLQAAAELAAKGSQLESVLIGLRNEMGLAVTPALTRIADRMLNWYDANKEVISQKIEFYAGMVAAAFTSVADAVATANKAVGGADGWVALSAVLASLAGASGIAYVAHQLFMVGSAIWGAVSAAAALVGGGTALLAVLVAVAAGLAQVVAIVGTLTYAYLMAEDFLTFLEGGDSVFGRLIEKWRDAPGFLGSVARAMEALGNVGRAVLSLLGIWWDNLVLSMQPAITMAKALGDALLKYVGKALDYIAPLLDIVANQLNNMASQLETPEAKAVAGVVGSQTLPGAVGVGSDLANSGRKMAASFAPTPSKAQAVGGGRSVSVGGDTITISGVGMTMPEVEQLIERKASEKGRATRELLAGAEV